MRMQRGRSITCFSATALAVLLAAGCSADADDPTVDAGTTPDAGTTVPDAGETPDAGEALSDQLKLAGGPCSTASDCTSECLQSEPGDVWRGGFCTKDCASHTDCGQGNVCETVLGLKKCFRVCTTNADCGRDDAVCQTMGASKACGPGFRVKGSLRAFGPTVSSVTLKEKTTNTQMTLTQSGNFTLPAFFEYNSPYQIEATTNDPNVSCLVLNAGEWPTWGITDAVGLELSCGAVNAGGPCRGNGDCGVVCQDWGFPDGYCTAACQDDKQCGPSGVCREYGAGKLCLRKCTQQSDCERPDYRCASGSCVPGLRLGGNVQLSAGATLTLTNAGGESMEITAGGNFTFPTLLAPAASYNVTATTNQADVSCLVLRGAGSMEDHVNNIGVICGHQKTFLEPGTHKWRPPAGVTSVSVVAVGPGGFNADDRTDRADGGGGGALCYSNNVPVSDTTDVTVVVGQRGSEAPSKFNEVVIANGGKNGRPAHFGGAVGPGAGGEGGTGDVCFNGGRGGGNYSGGGAAGYAGNGGKAYGSQVVPEDPIAAQDGAGGGGGGAHGGQIIPPNRVGNGAGGCVGLEGRGADGKAYGSGGNINGSQATMFVPCAGGGGGSYRGYDVDGDHGGVRIIWGTNRSYPDAAGNQ